MSFRTNVPDRVRLRRSSVTAVSADAASVSKAVNKNVPPDKRFDIAPSMPLEL
ncbi:hypothetical protein LJR034_003491 [Caballeronia sp. LjRoot34]|uniref:hypothetical protein n=1 Tax=Caballeronia sp. LjRoot34 TaxID=3342325 RepID=UPI003ED0EA0E